MESTPTQAAEGMAVVQVLAAVLERLVSANAPLARADPGQVTKFHALKAPGIGILQYLERIHKYASCSTECFILALIYIDRLIQRNNFLLTELNVHRVVITSVLLAAKFFDDAYYNNAYYAKVGGVLVSEMNSLEVEFLFRINFSLHVSPELYNKYHAELISHAVGTITVPGIVSALASPALTSGVIINQTASPEMSMTDMKQPASMTQFPPSSGYKDEHFQHCNNQYIAAANPAQITPSPPLVTPSNPPPSYSTGSAQIWHNQDNSMRTIEQDNNLDSMTSSEISAVGCFPHAVVQNNNFNYGQIQSSPGYLFPNAKHQQNYVVGSVHHHRLSLPFNISNATIHHVYGVNHVDNSPLTNVCATTTDFLEYPNQTAIPTDPYNVANAAYHVTAYSAAIPHTHPLPSSLHTNHPLKYRRLSAPAGNITTAPSHYAGHVHAGMVAGCSAV